MAIRAAIPFAASITESIPPILARHCRKVFGDFAGQISEKVDKSNKPS